ncbi:hypothetical protein B9Q03_11740 [Candidatus Marsarchaeota G2 archaeon OSP_D]|jgi:hypothetical protein|uniref:Uncharacterized protein n=1 Tax=Candidatus Marsarchaeota G2 archaeon OSP_D TaxID=1978157 RepID=A0A2R6AIY6_9ARCH|nr:MAG: hypothetical protein B9Q03_11740 [Candidatus Marsarchaeota G2 archaeon OSP_D]
MEPKIFFIKPSVPTSERMMVRLDVSDMTEEEVMEGVKKLGEVLRRLDEKYAKGPVKGRSNRIVVSYGKLNTEGGERTKIVVSFSPFPSNMMNALNRVRGLVYDTLKGLTLILKEEEESRFTTPSSVPYILRVQRAANERLEEVRKAMKDFMRTEDWKVVTETTKSVFRRDFGTVNPEEIPDVGIRFLEPNFNLADLIQREVEKEAQEKRKELERLIEQTKKDAEEEKRRMLESARKQIDEKLYETLKVAAEMLRESRSTKKVEEALTLIGSTAADLGFEEEAKTALRAAEALSKGEGVEESLNAVLQLRLELKKEEEEVERILSHA